MDERADGRLEPFTRTPLRTRLPVVLALAVSLLVAGVATNSVWVGLPVLAGMLVVSTLVLRFVFRIPVDRIFSYKEFEQR